ncbi:uncharacterized protein LOC144104324 isoform X3 [Amblyomma americanum]
MEIKAVQQCDGWYLNLLVGNCTQFLCKILEWNPAVLEYCVRCSCAPEILYDLPCSHSVCFSCSDTGAKHACPSIKEETATTKEHITTKHHQILQSFAQQNVRRKQDHVDSSHTRPETSRTSAPQLTANTSEHQQTSQNEKMRSTPPIQGPQDSVALEKIEAEVVMLKGYIKNLEERIQRLETPLRKLIQRLRERGRLTLAIQRDNI